MEKRWNIPIDGVAHNVVYQKEEWSGRQTLIVDGNAVNLESNIFKYPTGADYPITIGDRSCWLRVTNRNPDIAVNGRFVGSGMEYKPLGRVPWWGWASVIVCAVIPGISLGGLLPVLIGLLGGVLCLRLSNAQSMTQPMRVLACVGVSVIAWILFLLLV